MSYPFSEESKNELETCHPDLQRLFNKVAENYNCTIFQGERGEEAQNYCFKNGLSKVKYPGSKHNTKPLSEAVDSGPYPIRYPDENIMRDMTAAEKEQIERLKRWIHFCGYVKGVADTMGIKIRQGIDWNGNNVFTDQKFDDLPHCELKEE